MREFRKQRRDVRIQLFDADLPTLVKMVDAGRLDMSLGIFKVMPGMRREPTTTWSSLEGERMIALSSDHPHQQLIDKQLAQPAVKAQLACQRTAAGSGRVYLLPHKLHCHVGRAGVLSEGSSAGKFYNPAASIVLW
jgi:hypothetical protein